MVVSTLSHMPTILVKYVPQVLEFTYASKRAQGTFSTTLSGISLKEEELLVKIMKCAKTITSLKLEQFLKRYILTSILEFSLGNPSKVTDVKFEQS